MFKHYYLLLTTLFFCLPIFVQAQSADSLSILYERFFELQKIAESLQQTNLLLTEQNQEIDQKLQHTLDSLNQTLLADIDAISKNYEHFNEVLDANNEQISRISNIQLFTNKILVERNKARIINSTEFVQAAEVSLNTLNLSNQIFSYTDDITALHNPENEELGFSLTQRVNKTIEEAIFKGNERIGKIRKSKFLGIVDNILTSPIATAFTDNLPVVSALKGVIDMATNLAIENDDVSLEDLNNLKKQLHNYIEYYAGLDQARKRFDSKIHSIQVRTDALKILLRNFTQDRTKELYYPLHTDITAMDLQQLMLDYYNRNKVEQTFNTIISQECMKGSRILYEKAANDARLLYPDFAVSQARFIIDEIEAISGEYEASLNVYQKDIEKVLKKSFVIGNQQRIELKINELKNSKDNVIKAIKLSVNIKRLKRHFQALAWDSAKA